MHDEGARLLDLIAVVVEVEQTRSLVFGQLSLPYSRSVVRPEQEKDTS